VPFPQILSFGVQGVRTFNGDGTGKLVGRVLGIVHPFALPTTPPIFNRGSANSVDIESDFTYTVSPDLKVTITTPLVTGTVLTGVRAGQIQTITNLPLFTGYISEDLQSLTLAHEEPGVEIHAFSNGDSSERICHRARILHERKSNKHRGHHRGD
jgi:predicted metal-dependent phosphotriesterase family hydrolase